MNTNTRNALRAGRTRWTPDCSVWLLGYPAGLAERSWDAKSRYTNSCVNRKSCLRKLHRCVPKKLPRAFTSPLFRQSTAPVARLCYTRPEFRVRACSRKQIGRDQGRLAELVWRIPTMLFPWFIWIGIHVPRAAVNMQSLHRHIHLSWLRILNIRPAILTLLRQRHGDFLLEITVSILIFDVQNHCF